MSTKLKLDSLDIYSADTERVVNGIKRVIKFSNSEEKLFRCFDWYRDQALAKNKALWDRNFNHLVNREMGRMNISQDFAVKLRASLDNDIKNFRHQQSVGVTANPGTSIDAPVQLEDFAKAIKEISKVDEYTAYADIVKAGHEEAVFLGHILDILWKHQDKHLEVMNDDTGNKQLSKLDQRDRILDFARYMDSRAKWFDIEENQATLKAKLDGSYGKKKKNAKKRVKNKRQKEEDAGEDEAIQDM